MGAVPLPSEEPERELPDYLPARMVNEFVYCPRLFFYEWVEASFARAWTRWRAHPAQAGRLPCRSTR